MIPVATLPTDARRIAKRSTPQALIEAMDLDRAFENLHFYRHDLVTEDESTMFIYYCDSMNLTGEPLERPWGVADVVKDLFDNTSHRHVHYPEEHTPHQKAGWEISVADTENGKALIARAVWI